MRKPIAVVALVSVSASAGFAANAIADDPQARKAATRTVELGDNFFKPKRMTVRKGTILRFIWGPGHEGTVVEHNVTGVKGNKFTNGEDTTRPDRPYRKRITRDTSIVCTIHPTTMKMTVRIKR